MSTPPTATPAAPDKPLGVIETDLFCERCGFNLHTQRVLRDDRLDLLIVRCPECGGHQSAHLRTTAASKWLNRLAVVALLGWLGLSLAFLLALFFLFIGAFAGAEEGLTYRQLETTDGRLVQYRWNPKGIAAGQSEFLVVGTGSGDVDDDDNPFGYMQMHQGEGIRPAGAIVVAAKEVRQVKRPARWLSNPLTKLDLSKNRRLANQLTGIAILSTLIGAGVLIGGTCIACATWFWRARWRWVWVGLPLLAFLMVKLARTTDDLSYMYGPAAVQVDRSHLLPLDLSVLAALVGLFALSLWQGRRLARFLLTLLVPPGPRQLFAFLWHCDALEMPTRRPAPPFATAGPRHPDSAPSHPRHD